MISIYVCNKKIDFIFIYSFKRASKPNYTCRLSLCLRLCTNTYNIYINKFPPPHIEPLFFTCFPFQINCKSLRISPWDLRCSPKRIYSRDYCAMARLQIDCSTRFIEYLFYSELALQVVSVFLSCWQSSILRFLLLYREEQHWIFTLPMIVLLTRICLWWCLRVIRFLEWSYDVGISIAFYPFFNQVCRWCISFFPVPIFSDRNCALAARDYQRLLRIRLQS